MANTVSFNLWISRVYRWVRCLYRENINRTMLMSVTGLTLTISYSPLVCLSQLSRENCSLHPWHTAIIMLNNPLLFDSVFKIIGSLPSEANSWALTQRHEWVVISSTCCFKLSRFIIQ